MITPAVVDDHALSTDTPSMDAWTWWDLECDEPGIERGALELNDPDLEAAGLLLELEVILDASGSMGVWRLSSDGRPVAIAWPGQV